MENRNIKWHQLTGEEALRQLRSNASCGLSRKEARSRLRKGGSNDLFEFNRSSFALLRMLLTDPSLLLFAAVCLLTVCFAEFAVGIPALVLYAVWYLLLLCMVFRMRRRRDRLRESQIPRACVLRDGKPMRVSARVLVPGDVVLLRAGDVIPADCRLLDAAGLRTRLVLPAASGERPTVLLQEKQAQTVYPYGAKLNAPDYENLVYGGAEVVAGSARAVVTETGTHSFLGAMGRTLLREPLSGQGSLLSGIYPYLRLFGFALLVLMLPLSVVGLLISPESLSTLRVFLPLCALTASGTAAVPYILFHIMLYFPGRSGAVVKTDRGMDRLPYLTDLVILDHSATSDGLCHFHSASNGAQTFLSDTTGQQPGLQPLCEAFVLLFRARERLPQQGAPEEDRFLPLPYELTAISGYDLQALEVRLVGAVLHSTAQEQLLEVRMKETDFRLRFTTGIGAVSGCVGYESMLGGHAPLEPAMRERLRRFAQEAAGQGSPVLTVTKEQGGRTLLVGCVTRREALLPGIADTVRRLEAHGVQVRFFFPSQRREELLYAVQCGAREEQICLASEHPDPVECAGERWFAGYGRREIAQFVKNLRRQGRTVAVLTGAPEDEGILAAASLRIACDSEAVQTIERARDTGTGAGTGTGNMSPPAGRARSSAGVSARGDVALPDEIPHAAAAAGMAGETNGGMPGSAGEGNDAALGGEASPIGAETGTVGQVDTSAGQAEPDIGGLARAAAPAFSAGCPQVLLRDADLLLPGADSTGGGMPALLRLLRRTRGALARVQCMLKMLASFQIFRVVLLTLCVLTGAGSVTAYAFLYASVFVDLAAFALVAQAGVSQEQLLRPVSLSGESVRASFRSRRLWLIPLASAGAFALLLMLLRLTGLLSDECVYPMLFCAMLLMQVMLLVFNRESDGITLPPAGRWMSCLLPLLLPVLAAAVLSAFVPAVDTVTELGSWSAASAGLLVVSPFLVLLSVLLFTRFSEPGR